MIISPSVINFPSYKKYTALSPGVLVNFSPPFQPAPPAGNVLAFGVPSYLTVYDITANNCKVRLNSDANSVPPGDYWAKITIFQYQNTPYFSFGEFNYGNVVSGEFTVNITITDTFLLTVSQESASFNWEIGTVNPVNKSIFVTSENTWNVTKTAAWVLLPTTSGSNTGTFQIGVDTTGLTVGIYNDIVTVNDGVDTKTIAVSLTVTEPSTGSIFLYINPLLLDFGYSLGGTQPPQKTIELNASGAWTAASNQPWINLTIAAGGSGASIIPIALQNISGLAIGEHFANVTFTLGNINKTLTVKLTVYEFVTDILTSGELYFCDDENMIKVSSGRLDTFMQLEISSLYKSLSYYFPFSIPYFNGTTQKRIGSAPKKLIGDQSLVGFAQASLFSPYPTINLNIAISELELFTKNLVQTQSINNVKFVKGIKPLDNWISDAPRKIYATKTAVIYFSIITNGIEASQINVAGAIAKTFNFTPITSDLLTAVIPLAEVGALAVGDTISIEVLENTLEVTIKDEGKDSSIIYWANKWGVWDSVELTGRVIINDSYDRKTSTVRKTELQTETKLIDVTKAIDYKINTGWIHTDAEVITISEMLESKNMYLKTQNQLVKVNPTTNKLVLFDTDNDRREYTLTFDNVIEL